MGQPIANLARNTKVNRRGSIYVAVAKAPGYPALGYPKWWDDQDVIRAYIVDLVQIGLVHLVKGGESGEALYLGGE